MHKSLTLRFNIILVLIYLLILAACYLIGGLPTVWITYIYVLLGIITGAFQSLALKSKPSSFLSTKTASEVRFALLKTSVYGKISIFTVWSLVFLMLWLAFFKSDDMAKSHTILSSFISFMLFRELASMPGLIFLSRLKNKA
jgi:hypothetical protein